MITEISRNRVESGGAPIDSASYFIDPNNVVHIAQILRNLYADPIQAVVREYTSNALDAHVMNGTSQNILLHVPTTAEPWFSVRDFGGGLSVEETKNLLYGFGSSGEHKRTSNEQIGGFGLGSKSAFAVADNFQYLIWHDGMKRIWNCFLDESDMGKAEMFLETEDAAHLPGIEVKVPVKSGEAYRYVDAIKKVFQYLDAKPDFVDPVFAVEIPPQPESLFDSTISIEVGGRKADCKVQFTRANGTALILGGTCYDIDMSQLTFKDDTELGEGKESEQRHNLAARLTIHVPIGMVQVAPNREELQYSPRTKKVLSTLVSLATGDDMVELVIKSLAGSESSYATKAQLMGTLGIVKLKDDPWVGNGRLMMVDDMPTHTKTVSQWSAYDGSPAIFRSYTDDALPKSGITIADGNDRRDVFILVEDGKLPGETGTERLAARLTKKYYDSSELGKLYNRATRACAFRSLHVHVVERAAKDLIPWLADGSVLVVDEDDLPEMAASEQVTWMYSSHIRGGHRTPAVRRPSTKYEQHGRKFAKLKGAGSFCDSSRMSSFWETCTAKDTKEGVYIVHDRFCPVTMPEHVRIASWKLRELQSFINQDWHKDLVPRLQDGLLAVRDKDEGSIKGNPKFTNLWAYVKARFADDTEAGLVDMDGFLVGAWLLALEHDTTAGAKRVANLKQYIRGIVTADVTDEEVRAAATDLHRDIQAAKHGVTGTWARFIADLAHLVPCTVFQLVASLGLDISSARRADWWKLARHASPGGAAGFLETVPANQDSSTHRQLETVLLANIPVVSMAGIDVLFGGDMRMLSEAGRIHQYPNSTASMMTDQVKKFLDMAETYSIMNRNKQEGEV